MLIPSFFCRKDLRKTNGKGPVSYEEAKEIKRKRAFDWPSEQGEDDQKDLEGEDNNNSLHPPPLSHLT